MFAPDATGSRPVNENKKRLTFEVPNLPNKRQKIHNEFSAVPPFNTRRKNHPVCAGQKNNLHRRVSTWRTYHHNDIAVPPNNTNRVPRYIRFNKNNESTDFVKYCKEQPKKLAPIHEE